MKKTASVLLATMLMPLAVSSCSSGAMIGEMDKHDQNLKAAAAAAKDSCDGSTGDASTGDVNVSGNGDMQRDYTGLVSLGFTKIAAAGMMGNIKDESTGDPVKWEIGMPWSFDNERGGFGIVQWTGPGMYGPGGGHPGLRASIIKDLGAKFITSQYDSPPAHKKLSADEIEKIRAYELKYLTNQVKTEYGSLFSQLQSASSPSEAALLFLRYYERPSESVLATERPARAAAAESLYKAFANSAPASGSSSSSSSSAAPKPTSTSAPAKDDKSKDKKDDKNKSSSKASATSSTSSKAGSTDTTAAADAVDAGCSPDNAPDGSGTGAVFDKDKGEVKDGAFFGQVCADNCIDIQGNVVTFPNLSHVDPSLRNKKITFPDGQTAYAIASALSYVNRLYSWGGGNGAGPTHGDPYDAAHPQWSGVPHIGFDCSGLVGYAWHHAGGNVKITDSTRINTYVQMGGQSGGKFTSGKPYNGEAGIMQIGNPHHTFFNIEYGGKSYYLEAPCPLKYIQVIPAWDPSAPIQWIDYRTNGGKLVARSGSNPSSSAKAGK